MRRFLLAALSFVLLLPAAYGQGDMIVLSAKDTSLEQIFRTIETQSKYRFFYVQGLIEGLTADVSISSSDIDTVMEEVLEGLPLKYRVSNDTVYITADEKDRNEDVPSVEGKVTDEAGQPLAGVIVQNTETGEYSVSDTDGGYRINASPDDKLTFSCLGYESSTLNAGGRSKVDVSMAMEIQDLDEVVVIGYGVQRKSDLTSSIAKVSANSLVDMPVTSIESALQGQAAGVNIVNTSGRPGADVQIRIRGVGTVNNNEPLYIVDGMPVSDISYLNMSDVESIEILKDASSAAIYGTRAANGVVMVTTRKGANGGGATDSRHDLTVGFDAYWGMANPVRQLHPASADEYLEMVRQIYGEDANTYKLVKTEYDKGYNTNWWKEVNRKNAFVQNYNLSFNGGTDRLSYLMSANYLSQEGIDRKSSLKRISFRVNTSYKANDWLTIGENISITNEDLEGDGDSGEDGFVSSALRADPLYPVIDPDKHDDNPFNNYGSSSLTNIKNPVAAQDRYLQNRHGNDMLKIIGNVYAEIRFLKDFVFKTDFGVELSNGTYQSFSPVYFLEVDDQNQTANAWSQLDKGRRWTWINTLSYNKTFGKHRISAVLGYQAEEYSYQFLEGNKFGQPNNDLSFQWIDGGISGDRISGSRSEEALLSYFARVNWSYDDRYLLSASVRRDGSSKFAPGNQWGTFPAVSAGWNITNEPFFKDLGQDWLSMLKLRAGWGQLGNERISSGAYATFIEGRLDTKFFFNGEENVQGYGPVNAGNPEVSWERTETVNVGLDIALFRSRLTATVDWFNKDTKGMLMQVPIPDMFGTYSPWENVGKVNNRGWEVSAQWRDYDHKVKYSFGFNLSGYQNKVVSMGGTKPYVDSADGSSRIFGYCRTEEGQPIGFFYGYKTDGIFQTPREVNAYVNDEGELIQPNAHMGDFKFVDMDGDGDLDDDDKVNLGSPHPDFYFGINLSVAYAGFDLQATFNGTVGNEIFNAFKYYTHQPLGFANVQSGVVSQAWTVGCGGNSQPRMTLDDSNDNFRISDFYVEDGSYLRLKNLQIGYTFPAAWMNKIRMKTLRIYVAAQNLFTITSYSGLDPEIATGVDRSNGVDIGVYPQTRVFQLGLNIKF